MSVPPLASMVPLVLEMVLAVLPWPVIWPLLVITPPERLAAFSAS